MLELHLETSGERSLFFVLPNDRQAGDFDVLMRFGGGQVKIESSGRSTDPREVEQPKQVAGGVA
jgi:putative ABC transport system ATP-binding protein